MDEISASVEVLEKAEIKSELNNFKNIKPESSITYDESKQYINNLFELKNNIDFEISEKQSIANEAAQEYNAKYNPLDRAKQKGISDIKETPNGGVSFEDSKELYVKDNGEKGIARITATGKRSLDFDAANEMLGLSETPDGYVYHHKDDYDVKTNTLTLELVKDEAHNAAKPHSGGCAQYDAVNGASYNPVRKGA